MDVFSPNSSSAGTGCSGHAAGDAFLFHVIKTE